MDGKYHSLPLTVNIYGDTWQRDQIRPQLIWATQGHDSPTATSSQATQQRQISASSPSAGVQVNGHGRESLSQYKEQLARAAELRDILNNLEKVNNAERRSSLLDQLCATEDVLNLPEYPDPPSVKTGELKIDLLRHQVSYILYICDLAQIPVATRSAMVLQPRVPTSPQARWRKTGAFLALQAHA